MTLRNSEELMILVFFQNLGNGVGCPSPAVRTSSVSAFNEDGS